MRSKSTRRVKGKAKCRAMLEGGPCSACKERAAIRQQIKQLQEEIAKLKARHHSLGSSVNAIHDPFIHKFPPEIGSQIFRLSLPKLDNRRSNRLVIQQGLAAVLRLGAVCRQWRQLAWATPDIWGTIYLAIQWPMRRSLAKSLPNLLREWLGRSGVSPLTIVFLHTGCSEPSGCEFRRFISNDSTSNDSTSNDSTSNDSTSNDSTSNDSTSKDSASNDSAPKDSASNDSAMEVATGLVIEILSLHSSRWRNVHLNAVADIFRLFSGHRVQPKQLDGLDLTANHSMGRDWPTEFRMESDQNPTHLELNDFPLTLIDIGWDKITHATLHNTSIEEVFEPLRRACNLECYRFSIDDTSGSSIGFETPILHPRLRSLNLLAATFTNEFLEAITLPSLEEWTQTLDDDIDEAALLMTMLSMLERSSCRLKVLNLEAIQGFFEDLDTLVTLLHETPSLEHLRLSFHWVSNDSAVMIHDIFTRIFSSAGGGSGPKPSLLPCLQILECNSSKVTPFSWDRIPQLYRQGHRQSLTLKSTALYPQIRDETALQLLQLLDEGVDLQIIDSMGGDFLENFRNRIQEQEN